MRGCLSDLRLLRALAGPQPGTAPHPQWEAGRTSVRRWTQLEPRCVMRQKSHPVPIEYTACKPSVLPPPQKVICVRCWVLSLLLWYPNGSSRLTEILSRRTFKPGRLPSGQLCRCDLKTTRMVFQPSADRRSVQRPFYLPPATGMSQLSGVPAGSLPASTGTRPSMRHSLPLKATPDTGRVVLIIKRFLIAHSKQKMPSHLGKRHSLGLLLPFGIRINAVSFLCGITTGCYCHRCLRSSLSVGKPLHLFLTYW